MTRHHAKCHTNSSNIFRCSKIAPASIYVKNVLKLGTHVPTRVYCILNKISSCRYYILEISYLSEEKWERVWGDGEGVGGVLKFNLRVFERKMYF